MKTFTTQVSPHFHGPFLPSLVSLVTQFSTIQHSFQVPSEEPGPGVCQALCWAAVVRWPYQTGPLPKLIFNRKSSQRRGQLREGVQGECGSGKLQGGVRKQRQQAGEGPEAEGTAQVERQQADEGPEAEGTAQVKGRKESGTFWGPESDGRAVTSGWPFLKRRRKGPAIKTDMKRKRGRAAEKGLCVHSVSRVENKRQKIHFLCLFAEKMQCSKSWLKTLILPDPSHPKGKEKSNFKM